MRIRTLFLLFLILTGCQYLKPLDDRLIADNDKVRTQAINKVASLSDDEKSKLVPPLIKHLKNPEPRIANRAMEALTKVGPAAIESLKPLLKDKDVFIRVNTVLILERMGSAARPAVPALAESMKDPHPLVREEAALAIIKINQVNPPANPS